MPKLVHVKPTCFIYLFIFKTTILPTFHANISLYLAIYRPDLSRKLPRIVNIHNRELPKLNILPITAIGKNTQVQPSAYKTLIRPLPDAGKPPPPTHLPRHIYTST